MAEEREVKLILTVDNAGLITGVRVASEETDKLGDRAGKLGDQTKKMGEAGRLGFFALGNAIEDSARSMGVAGQASRQLGNSVERVAASALPGFGTALGVAVLAVTVLVGVVTTLIDRKEKLREETIKQGEAAAGLINSLIDERTYTAELKREIEELNQSKRKMASEDIERAIQAQTQKVIELSQAVEDGGTTLQRFKQSFTAAFTDDESYIKAITRDTDEATTAFNKAVIALQDLYIAQRKNKEGKPKGEPPDDTAAIEMENRAYAAQKEFEWEQQLGQARAAYEQAQLAEHKKNIKSEIASDEQLMQNKARVYGGISQILSQAYMVGHQRHKALFYASQTAAASESIIQGHLAGSKAIGQLGPFGLPLAPILVGMGYANATLIAAQTFEGGGGGGGGGGSAAMPTFSANPTTGLPDNGGYRYYSYEQSEYGSGWRPGEGPGRSGDTYIFHGDVYDKESFDKRVNKSVQRNIRDKGETRDVIQRFANA